jgi:TadE-like protein
MNAGTRERCRDSTRGSVTAEFAIVLPALTAVLALLLLGAVVGMTQLRLEEAARSAARALARGDSVATAVAGSVQIAGAGVQTGVEFEDGFVRVRTSTTVSGPLSGLIGWPLTASATAKLESITAAEGPEPGTARPR